MKSAIVTGASRGIGRAVAEMLLAEGWEVIGVSRTPTLIGCMVGGKQRASSWINLDVSDPESLGWLWFAELPPRSVDAVVHCAGVRGPYGPFIENDPEAWAATISTNLLGTARIVRAALPSLMKSDDARILLFSGGGAFSPEPNYSAYAASKGATVALMETLAVELIDSTVTVNCVAPGFVATDIHKGTPHAGRDDHGAMQRAVACVRHLLGHQAYGLSGRTVSAQYDEWENLTPWTIPHLGDQGTRTRHLIAGLEKRVIRARRMG